MNHRHLIAFATVVGFGPIVSAQPDPDLQPSAYAIRGATVVVEPGRMQENATVVIRDGLIEAITGADVAPPPDALIIDGTGKMLYPGLVDALSVRGYDESLRRSVTGPAEDFNYSSTPSIATRPDHRKGLMPDFTVRTALTESESDVEPWRELGFTTRLVAPEGDIISGQSTLVSLNGRPPRSSVLRSPVAMHFAFDRVSGGDYPRALMGIIAHTRQILLDAGHYERLWDDYDRRGQVGQRPPNDPALEALIPVLAGALPAIIEADTADEIHQALDFAEEHRLRLIILGGREAWKVVDRLKITSTPVILRLDFTEEDDDEEELPRRVREDREREREEEHGCAWILHQNGIRFAFSTDGIGGDKAWEKFRDNLLQAIEAGLPADVALAALTRNPAQLFGLSQHLGAIEPGRPANLVLTDGDLFTEKTQVAIVFADGIRFEYEIDEKTNEEPKDEGDEPKDEKEDEKPDEPKEPDNEKPEVATELESDRVPAIQTGGDVLIRGATVLTVSEQGTLAQTDMLVRDGKIAAIGQDLPAPANIRVIDATGMFVMPGIIDTHSHFGIRGGVNEFSLSVVPEVRVRDVIESDDIAAYRSLAGGVTTARLLHGSANVIGGQDAVIKLKYGRSANEMLLAEAPRGVKFALGENVKRTDGRFPNSRLGVEAVLIRAFSEAQSYEAEWERYRQSLTSARPLPEPRRDLRLEALADVLAGDLRVHCHCYRADEILMLLQVADRFGFQVKSLQHVLEGYKIAPEIAAHGASCSLFSDWWAYKIEAFDAIPYAAALVNEAGGKVCLKSDSTELVRHLYQEAAKLVKYGGMSELDALKTITLNAAEQLGLQDRIGSIEVGKDADVAIFNGHPLNAYARCEMTLVEGEVFFQRSEQWAPSPIAAAGPATPVQEPITLPERSPSGTYAIVNVTMHPVSGPVAEGMTVLVREGQISAIVGKDEERDPGLTVIDGRGMHLYPGMIDAGTVLGLTEIGSADETQDYSDGGEFQPDLRASIAINPDSELIPVTRVNGVLTVVTRPTGAMIAGQAALINLAGWVPAEMAVVDPLALQVELPSLRGFFQTDPNAPFSGRSLAKREREEKIDRLRELFEQALLEDAARQLDPTRPLNPRLAALVPYAKGEKPVIIQAERESEIREALDLIDELQLTGILSGALDAWKVADELKERDIPVIFGPVMTLPGEEHDPYDAPYACPAHLYEAGVRFCIRSGGGSNTRNLPYEAAMAIAYGLPPEVGLKAVTLYPAEILGVGDELGTIEPGKRANLVLTNGDILQPSTEVLALFIDGKPLAPESKQTRLYERYRERLREVESGQAPLGVGGSE